MISTIYAHIYTSESTHIRNYGTLHRRCSSLGMSEQRNLFASFAFILRLCVFRTRGYVADEFPREILPPDNIVEHIVPIGPACASYKFHEEFTLHELHTTLQMFRRRRGPGEYGITCQYLRNLDHILHRSRLGVCSAVWQTGAILLFWRTSVVCPLLQRGKDPHESSSYRLVSLTSCVETVMEKNGRTAVAMAV